MLTCRLVCASAALLCDGCGAFSIQVCANTPVLLFVEGSGAAGAYLSMGSRVAGMGAIGAAGTAQGGPGGLCHAAATAGRDGALPLMIERAPVEAVADAQPGLCVAPWLAEYHAAAAHRDVDGFTEYFERVTRAVECAAHFVAGRSLSEAALEAREAAAASKAATSDSKGPSDQGGQSNSNGDTAPVAALAAKQSKAASESDELVGVPSRQQLMREQGVIDGLVDLLEVLSDLIEAARGSGAGHKARRLMRLMAAFCKVVFRALHHMIAGNAVNQLYVADRFPVLISYLGSGATAMRCVTELLNNLEIQENKVSSREIDLFIGMLRAGGINHTLMTVLGALCSCQDQGIDSNQTMLTGVLLLRSEDLLVKFFVGDPDEEPVAAAARAAKRALAAAEGEDEAQADPVGELLVHCPGERLSQRVSALREGTLRYFIAQVRLSRALAATCCSRHCSRPVFSTLRRLIGIGTSLVFPSLLTPTNPLSVHPFPSRQ